MAQMPLVELVKVTWKPEGYDPITFWAEPFEPDELMQFQEELKGVGTQPQPMPKQFKRLKEIILPRILRWSGLAGEPECTDQNKALFFRMHRVQALVTCYITMAGWFVEQMEDKKKASSAGSGSSTSTRTSTAEPSATPAPESSGAAIGSPSSTPPAPTDASVALCR